MTTEQEILSFEKKLEQCNFVLDDKMLAQLLKGKMERLRRQSQNFAELRSLTKRHKQ